jgi:methyl-accepting chemotaxis protein
MEHGHGNRKISVKVWSLHATALLFLLLVVSAFHLLSDRAADLRIATIAAFALILGYGVIASIGSISLIRSILLPIRKMAEVIKGMMNGDLTKRIDVEIGNEIGVMAAEYDVLTERLRKAFLQFSKTIVVVSSAAHLLDESTKQMISGVEQAATQVNSVATASEEMSHTSAEISKNCSAAARNSGEANESAIDGESIISGTLSTMDHINTIVRTAAQTMETLGHKSDQIGEVVDLINDIADQTNLLALNAAIEAARAGEHGRGFAVVADEVRKLAEKTTGATMQIGKTIEDMQRGMHEAVRSMEDGVKEVAAGTEGATRSVGALKAIAERINLVAAEVGQIAVASEQQTIATNEIAGNIQQISTVVRETATGVGKNAGAASQLADLSANLKKFVGQFRLATPDDAKAMVEKARNYFNEEGREKALAAFNDPNGQFIRGELFVLAQDYHGVILAYGGNPDMVGQNLGDAKDPDGKPIGGGMMEVARRDGQGWYEYSFMNPFTQVVMPKRTYVQAMDGFYLACGVYK